MTTGQQRLDALLSEAEMSAIRAPIAQARTFPNHTFTSEAFFEFEQRKVSRANWVAIAFDAQIPNIGDVLPVDAFGDQLIAVRGEDQTVRVFHNRCPYDACPVVVDPRIGAKRLVVAYHGWVYSLAGELVAAPYWDGTPNGPVAELADRARLEVVRSDVSMGVIFVDLSGQAASLEEALTPFRQDLDEYDLDNLAVVTQRGRPALDTREVNTNWRTYSENALNVLHENFVHDVYRKSDDHPRVTANGKKRFVTHKAPGMFGFSYAADDVATYGSGLLPHIGRGEAAPERGHFFYWYPNFTGAVIGESVFAASIILPLSAARTTVVSASFIKPSAQRNLLSGILNRVFDNGFDEAAREDGWVIEAIQQSRASSPSTSQFFSPYWDDGHYRFTNRLLDDLERTERP